MPTRYGQALLSSPIVMIPLDRAFFVQLQSRQEEFAPWASCDSSSWAGLK